MKLTHFTDCSLRVLIFLAAHPGRRATVAEVAESFNVSAHHLTKVVHFLGKEGWLTNWRGKGGGMELAVAPAQICIGRVVRAAEGTDLPAECFGDEPDNCPIARICRLRGVFHEAVEAFYAVLDRYCLEDLAHNRAALERVLGIRDMEPRRRAARA